MPPMYGEFHFGKRNYLGPGTRYKYRRSRNVQPMDELDAIAMKHDALYSRTNLSLNTFQGKFLQNYARGAGDLFYGGQMIGTDVLSPYGYALVGAGLVRWLTPAFVFDAL